MKVGFEIYQDEDCTLVLKDMGNADIGEVKEIPFYIKNTGETSLIDVQIEYSFEDVEIEAKIPNALLPGNVIKGKIIWKPSGEEGRKNGKMQIFARSIGRPE